METITITAGGESVVTTPDGLKRARRDSFADPVAYFADAERARERECVTGADPDAPFEPVVGGGGRGAGAGAAVPLVIAAEAIAPKPGAFPDPGGTAGERAALLADLLALARDWEAGRMPLAVLARQMTPFERWGARWAQPVDGSADDLLLRRLFDALCRDGTTVQTHQGTWTADEWRKRAPREAVERIRVAERARRGR